MKETVKVRDNRTICQEKQFFLDISFCFVYKASKKYKRVSYGLRESLFLIIPNPLHHPFIHFLRNGQRTVLHQFLNFFHRESTGLCNGPSCVCLQYRHKAFSKSEISPENQERNQNQPGYQQWRKGSLSGGGRCWGSG